MSAASPSIVDAEAGEEPAETRSRTGHGLPLGARKSEGVRRKSGGRHWPFVAGMRPKPWLTCARNEISAVTSPMRPTFNERNPLSP